MNPRPSRGEIWMVDLNPVRGHEQSGKRPALIVSVDLFNHGPAGLLVVLPVTSKDKGIPFHVRLEPPEGGLSKVSFVKCEDVRSIATEGLVQRRGMVSTETMGSVIDRLRILMGM